MSVYCPDLNLLYLCNPQTASTSAQAFFFSKYGGIKTPRKHDCFNDLKKSPEPLDSRVVENAFIVTSIRNPFDMLGTGYLKQKFRKYFKNGEYLDATGIGRQENYGILIESVESFPFTLAEFIKHKTLEMLLLRQKKFVAGVDDIVVCELGVQKEIDRVLKRIGIKNKHKVPSLNRIKGKDYRSLYNQRTKQMVRKKLKPWLDYAGYDFQGFHPDQSQLLKDLRKKGRK